MKTIRIATAFLLSVVLLTATKAQQAESRDQLVVPLSEPGKPFKLNVNVLNGSIKVVAYEGKDIVIDVTDAEREKSKHRGMNINIDLSGHNKGENTSGMKRISGGRKLDVSAEENKNEVTVRASTGSTITLSIKVPMQESKMKLRTVNDGDIVVTNVNGELEVSNVNGAITMSGISGSVVANANNEDIKVGFKSIDPNAAMAFSSLNGNIDVTFPAALKANVKLKADQGEMFTDFDIDADKSTNVPKKTASNGTYRINLENWVYGKIGGGGPELMMKNLNGNIYIRKAK